MNLQDLKIGTLMTLSKNEQYRIVDIRIEDNKNYIVCSTNKKPILPIVFEYRIIGEKLQVREEKDSQILKSIYSKLRNENS